MGDNACCSSLLKKWFLGRVGYSRSLPRILLLDGGVSTHLENEILKENHGLDNANTPRTSSAFPNRELWSSGLLLETKGRDRIRKGHLDWLEAGANVISTVTYQCHFESHLWPAGDVVASDVTMDQMWKDGIDLARQAVAEYYATQQVSSSLTDDSQPRTTATQQRPHFVISSSGCYGAALANGAEYTGDYGLHHSDDDEEEDGVALKTLQHFHWRKLRAAIDMGPPDGVAIETVPSLLECRALRDLLLSLDDAWDDVDGRTPACYISLACRNGNQLNDGSTLQEALDVLRPIPESRLQAIGLNCCDSQYLPSLLDILVRELAEQSTAARRGIVIYPNSGEAYDASNEQWVAGTGVTESSAMAPRLFEMVQHIESKWRQYSGQQSHPIPSILVGGCCRTDPATIAALAKRIDAHLANE